MFNGALALQPNYLPPLPKHVRATQACQNHHSARQRVILRLRCGLSSFSFLPHWGPSRAMAAYGASWKRGSRLQCPAPRLEISLRLGEVGNGVAWQRVCPVGFAGSCSQQIDYPIPYPQGITKARKRGDGSSSQRCYLARNGSVLASGWLKLSGHEAGRRTDTPDQPLNKNASVEATQEPSSKLPDHGVQCSNAWPEPCSGPRYHIGGDFAGWSATLFVRNLERASAPARIHGC